MLSFDISET
jgi:hypothetical protein